MREASAFLVDENLSVLLPTTAQARGWGCETTHVNHRGLKQAKDWDICLLIARRNTQIVHAFGCSI